MSVSGKQQEFFAPILAACAPIADVDTALDAEFAVSALLGGAYAAADEDRAAAVARFADDLVSVLDGRGDALAGALLAGLSGVAPAEAAARAGAALDAESRPAWAAEIGTARCTDAWAMSDVYGDQTEFVLIFEFADGRLGGAPHACCVLTDANLSVVKDCWASTEPERVLADCRRSAADNHDLRLVEVAPSTARSTIEPLLAGTDELPELPDSTEFAEDRALLLARLATLPAAPAAGAGAAADPVAEFLAAPEASIEDAPDGVVEACARLIAEYAPADPHRWSPTSAERFLVDWVPASAVLDAECVDWLPTVLLAFVTYSGHRRGLPEDAVMATQEAIRGRLDDFAAAMADAGGNAATAAQVARAMLSDGVDPTDQDAVRSWLATNLPR
ncbi:hypothetical protein Athai_64890 [Actinocatenispora thailandica]|uniref:Uncharacterized protein n=1 Tax=Actinocatenispora thailandica TaxID=227318 RepID=A0A7R7DW80_9ACTN|nr:hypothetical protein [Actinocatenispora thailandica]BCJ38986.1 hypothetical protein Athai_64890 [Actinocatenispora thailandica]